MLADVCIHSYDAVSCSQSIGSSHTVEMLYFLAVFAYYVRGKCSKSFTCLNPFFTELNDT